MRDGYSEFADQMLEAIYALGPAEKSSEIGLLCWVSIRWLVEVGVGFCWTSATGLTIRARRCRSDIARVGEEGVKLTKFLCDELTDPTWLNQARIAHLVSCVLELASVGKVICGLLRIYIYTLREMTC